MNYIKAKYLKNDIPDGRAYTYRSEENLSVGDKVETTDGNFTSSLNGASVDEIKEAIEIMKNRDGKDKGRMDSCYRELRKRSRQV